MKPYFTVWLAILFAPLPAMASELLRGDIQEAKIVTITTKVTPGHLNIANGRNCLVEGNTGQPVLAACQNVPVSDKIADSTVHYIIFRNNQCLSDNENGHTGVVRCDYQDTKQQWKALQAKGTDIRNVASNKCLTAAGLDKQVNLAVCNGIPAQYWRLTVQ
ncbi:hypothetical protein ACIOZM_20745 [Pseudomonas sp. NPDC087346]|uniref:hypothetical protein n=1 Tax=Pseudomonas sp. NPDC087346 TaxID=3364438 RepID=UPI00381B6151